MFEMFCPLCGSRRSRRVGVRGTREFAGADPNREPHLVTTVLRCADCDFFYAQGFTAESEALELDHYSDSLKYPGLSDGHVGSLRLRLSAIERHCRKGRLLDVGAGKGEFVALASAAGWQATGLEPSPALAHHARERGADVRTGHVVDAIMPSERFEAISLLHVLEHVSRPLDLLQLLRRYLKEGGVLLVEVPNCDSYVLRLADWYYRLRGRHWSTRLSPFHPPYHRMGFTRRSLAFAMGRGGYAVIEFGTLSGSDRGCRLHVDRRHPLAVIRATVSRALEVFGNRELLYVVAKPSGSVHVDRSRSG